MSWIFYTLSLKNSACKKINSMYSNINKYNSISFMQTTDKVKGPAKKKFNSTNYFDVDNICLLKNYYVKTAYNCCCGDGYKNNFVNICALEKCIELGARCLDFEIYSYNSEPIVAASTANNNSIKETYNYLNLKDIFTILNNLVFSRETQCGNDPMFLHFRIMSENAVIYDKIADYINNVLDNNDNYLLDIQYNYKNIERDKKILFHKPIKEFSQKFIIMINTLYKPILENSKLANYANILTGTRIARLLRYEQLIAGGNNNPSFIDESHRSLIIVLPNINNEIYNYDPILAMNNGCQFIGMKFQNLDNNLKGYLKQFKEAGGFSFRLKPLNLRQDIILPNPKENDSPLRDEPIIVP